MSKRQSLEAFETSKQLWAISAKVLGLGHLIKHMSKDFPPTEDDVFLGIGLFLEGLGKEIESVHKDLTRDDEEE